MISFRKHFGYADDIYLFSHRVMDFGQMALNLERDASRVGVKVNTNKAKFLRLMYNRTLHIYINGQSIEGVDQFVYLGIVVSTDGANELDLF